MSLADRLTKALTTTTPLVASSPILDAFNTPYGGQVEILKSAVNRISEGRGDTTDRLLVDTMNRNASLAGWGGYSKDHLLKSASSSTENLSGYIGVNDYGFKGKRQYIADRRYLLDLYVIAYNNSDVRTAVTHQRNEIFRRGIEWEGAFEYKCAACEKNYTGKEAKKMQGKCVHEKDDGQKVAVPLKEPREPQKAEFDKFMKTCNYFGQSLETILRELWDDISVVDDAFLFVSKEYFAAETEEGWKITSQPKFLFRLDPVLVEFDLDQRGIPGMRHHVCLMHRDELLEVPPGEGWELEWKGVCPHDKLPTYPVVYKYNEQYLQGGYGTAQSKVLYLTAEEVIHWSYYTPSELYGYPPILSIYEKALTLIGMDRYLYDYFYERRVPQGIISTTTDDPQGIESVKAELQSRMAQDPHYIPWITVSAKTGAGKTEFIRFAYSLDELNYLPIRDEIRERIAGIYGVSNIWMASTTGIGGLNNESQQLVVMSRVVEGAQRVFQEQVFPPLLKHFGVTDWILKLKQPEETSELTLINIKTSKATWAQMMAGMGFGVTYDQDEDEYTITGKVLSMQEQQQAGMEQQLMGGGGEGGQGGGDIDPHANEPQANAGAQQQAGGY
jgi:hypothetical protein